MKYIIVSLFEHIFELGPLSLIAIWQRLPVCVFTRLKHEMQATLQFEAMHCKRSYNFCLPTCIWNKNRVVNACTKDVCCYWVQQQRQMSHHKPPLAIQTTKIVCRHFRFILWMCVCVFFSVYDSITIFHPFFAQKKNTFAACENKNYSQTPGRFKMNNNNNCYYSSKLHQYKVCMCVLHCLLACLLALQALTSLFHCIHS